MPNNPSGVLFSFDRPATYQISVQGRFDPKWVDRLDSMSIIKNTAEPDCPPTTILDGYLADQAALVGVLTTLYELHLTIILVRRLET